MATGQDNTTGRNPSIRLAIIRSRIDQTQRVIAELEQRLQEAILGGTSATSFADELTPLGVITEIAKIYGDDVGGNFAPNLSNLTTAYAKGIDGFDGTIGSLIPVALEQDSIRQLLYQARALLGELRVEEQHWNGEVNEEKQRRKELGDFAKA